MGASIGQLPLFQGLWQEFEPPRGWLPALGAFAMAISSITHGALLASVDLSHG
ncbi:MAG: hypothetical protein RLZZ158_601 [Cyanobacteriota bacterium]|jgi:hypothetical protein